MSIRFGRRAALRGLISTAGLSLLAACTSTAPQAPPPPPTAAAGATPGAAKPVATTAAAPAGGADASGSAQAGWRLARGRGHGRRTPGWAAVQLGQHHLDPVRSADCLRREPEAAAHACRKLGAEQRQQAAQVESAQGRPVPLGARVHQRGRQVERHVGPRPEGCGRRADPAEPLVQRRRDPRQVHRHPGVRPTPRSALDFFEFFNIVDSVTAEGPSATASWSAPDRSSRRSGCRATTCRSSATPTTGSRACRTWIRSASTSCATRSRWCRRWKPAPSTSPTCHPWSTSLACEPIRASEP